tara:strand:+ start:347 stop:499 length:153 start_codon:yes stop_codon:yes gene_type:complete
MRKDRAFIEFGLFTDFMQEFIELYNEEERKILSDTWIDEYYRVLKKRHNQ